MNATATAQHTPTPWHRNIKADGKYPVIFSGRNTHVMQAVGHGKLSGNEIEANIDLVVRAVNAFEPMREALKLARSWMTFCAPPVESVATRKRHDHDLDIVDAALKLAE